MMAVVPTIIYSNLSLRHPKEYLHIDTLDGCQLCSTKYKYEEKIIFYTKEINYCTTCFFSSCELPLFKTFGELLISRQITTEDKSKINILYIRICEYYNRQQEEPEWGHFMVSKGNGLYKYKMLFDKELVFIGFVSETNLIVNKQKKRKRVSFLSMKNEFEN